MHLLNGALSKGLDGFFELTGEAAKRRRWRFLLMAAVFVAAGLGLHLALDSRTGVLAGAVTESVMPRLQILLALLRLLLLLGIAALLALQITGTFVTDIFELNDARIAWRFVGRLAGGSTAEVLHLRGGQVAEADRNAASVQIGGPALVLTDDETAALFEKPDGTPHVVGPTAGSTRQGRRGSGAWLDGFERLREPVISLRDQYIGNPSGEPMTVIGRSLDGIPISVMDVRGVFSVRRNGKPTDAEANRQGPYPLRLQDIERLIYSQAVEVLTNGAYASGLPRDWASNMHALIRDSLQDFMGQHRLAEFLAGVGKHEAELSEYRADTILSKTLEVSSEAPELASTGSIPGLRYRPRTELSAKFRKYGSEFSTEAQQSGLELHWIGVGTWKVPDERSEQAVTAKHIEAWQMNRENASRLESDALDTVAQNALLEHKLQIMQEVPLDSHLRSRERYSDKTVLMECLLEDFLNQLGDALDIYYRAGTPSSEVDELEEAVSKLERLLKVSQMGHTLDEVQGSRIRKRQDWDRTLEGPPAPATRGEAVLYRALLTKLNGDYRVAEAMLLNEKRRHSELSREQLIARIVERFERHGH